MLVFLAIGSRLGRFACKASALPLSYAPGAAAHGRARAGLALTLAVGMPYVVLLGMRRARMERLRLPAGWGSWLTAAAHEEEAELAEAIRPGPGTWRDGLTAAVALIAVVGASITMEQAATALGRRYAVADIIVGALVLAVVTSLPNAVTAVYLARRGRGAAVLSTALTRPFHLACKRCRSPRPVRTPPYQCRLPPTRCTPSWSLMTPPG